MLSIITCTTDLSKSQKLYDNVVETIGVDFEFLPFDNSRQKLGLCQVYNRQARLAKGEIICFVHDDVLFLTQGWGRELVRIFKEPNIGLIGVAGSAYKTAAPSMWTTAPEKLLASNIIQHYKYSSKEKEHLFWRNAQNNECDVVTVDGVFLVTTKSVWSQHSFDEVTFQGFHCYDMDFSFQVRQTHRVVVTYGILMEHFSEGSVGYDWLTTNKKISEKWKSSLPTSTVQLTWLQKDRLEYAAMFVGFRILGEYKRKSAWLKFRHLVYCFKPSFILMPFLKKKIDKQLQKHLQS